eukprot:TRINITY_DN6017_c0_g1_i2.p1 TRINITY_DN6017_c0_g1~~TRINITY_DN6017_c0_g1_i2.p1  ORF type:complete len:461 (+),score=105.65 TRINITY_DN6017_c0_g1_i2:105-1487(+)
MASPSQVDLNDPSTKIEVVLGYIVKKLELTEEPLFNERANMKVWVTKLHEHWIFNLGLLRRIDVARLSKLDLPLLLEEELERIALGKDDVDNEQEPEHDHEEEEENLRKTVQPKKSARRKTKFQKNFLQGKRKNSISSEEPPAYLSPINSTVAFNVKNKDLNRLSLSEPQKQLIKASWEKILKYKSEDTQVSTITHFFDEFYKRFFEVNPSGKRLFEQAGMTVQSRALLRMLSLIIKGIDKPAVIVDDIQMLGGRHAIYGVENDDYVAFSNAMADTFEAVLGKEEFSVDARNAWLKVLSDLATMMQESGSFMKRQSFSGVFYRKLDRGGSWKKTLVVINLDSIIIYKDEKGRQLRVIFPLSSVNDIDLNEGRAADAPTDFGFILNMNAEVQKPPELYFCFDSQKDLSFWVDQFTWRIQAIQRVYKEVEVESPSPEIKESKESSEDGVRLSILKKQSKFLQ